MKMTDVLHMLERTVLILIAVLTFAAVALELKSIAERMEVTLADLLLLFLYTEIIAMISVFYASRRLQVSFPIFIAMTALARLIVLQGKDMDPANILYEAGSILVLSIAVLVISRLDPRITERTDIPEDLDVDNSAKPGK